MREENKQVFDSEKLLYDFGLKLEETNGKYRKVFTTYSNALKLIEGIGLIVQD